ncbi:conserved hypothetical protein (plasmid) [Novosphingobium sp. PP1Y]|nr:conserved hypothetical protein [Novosphingobium sp. PP1Y]
MRSPSPLCVKRLIAASLARREGLAMIEFAFAFPVFALVVLGGLETVHLAMAHMRVNQIAITVADNAGRVRTAIDETNINEVFAGADLVGKSLGFASNGRIVLSSLQPNEQSGTRKGQMINWQRCHGNLSVDPRYGREGAGKYDASLVDGMGGTGRQIQAAEGTAVMFVEVTYRYDPLISGVLGSGPQFIRYESAFNVRERTNQDISNVQGLGVNRC